MHNTRKNEKRKLSYADAIREGTDQAMQEIKNLVVIGEGVPDPMSIFKTTAGLREKYGNNRVFDMPVSENGLTGVCIGAAIDGMRVLMTHQRIDFAMLAMDQIINNAAKWYYMFDGKSSVPIVIRMIVGRGWGQGPQHSQNLQALFAHIPGLKVVTPSTARDAKGMLVAALKDNNPVIFIEHRWLHHMEDYVPKKIYQYELGKAQVIRKGSDATIVSNSLMTIESIKAANVLSEVGIDIEIVDLRSIKPIDFDTILRSIEKTRKLIVVDSSNKTGSISGEIVSMVVENNFDLLDKHPLRITSPDHAVPTSHFQADEYYQDAKQIANKVLNFFGQYDDVDIVNRKLQIMGPLDVPNRDFHGPF
jgi:acetoin:2,6-dichlorophenolindophenol oxidoreductase subunit beta